MSDAPLTATIRPPFGAARERRDFALDFASIGDPDRLQLHAQCLRHRLDNGPLSNPSRARLAQDAHARHPWRDFLEQFEPFPTQDVFELDKAGRIAARPRQALNKAVADRIDSLGEHDRHGAARLLQRPRGPADAGQDHVRAKRDQFHRIPAQARVVAHAPAGVDPHVAADRPTRFLQPLQECGKAGLGFRFVGCRVHEHADTAYALLGARDERRRDGRTTEKRHELPPPHTAPWQRRHRTGLNDYFDSAELDY